MPAESIFSPGYTLCEGTLGTYWITCCGRGHSRQLWLKQPCSEGNRLKEDAGLWRKDEAFGRAALSYFPFRRRAKVSGTMICTELPDTSSYFCAIWASLFLHHPDNGKPSADSSCEPVPAWKKTTGHEHKLVTHETSTRFSACAWPLLFKTREWAESVFFHFITNRGKRKQTILWFYIGLHAVHLFNRLDIEPKWEDPPLCSCRGN